MFSKKYYFVIFLCFFCIFISSSFVFGAENIYGLNGSSGNNNLASEFITVNYTNSDYSSFSCSNSCNSNFSSSDYSSFSSFDFASENSSNLSSDNISCFDLSYDGSFADVQSAIDSTGSGGSVFLNNCSFIGSGTQLVISQDNFVLDGSDPSIAGSFSVLDADGLSRVLYITGHDVTLRNIVLIKGYYSSSSDLSSVGAGAVFVSYGAFVDHCVFVNNFVSGVKEAHGAGLSFVETDDVGVQNSEFINDTVYALNSYSGGAGLFSTSDNTVIYNCSFTDCKSYSKYSNAVGGGLQIAGSDIVGYVKNCSFVNNSCESINDSIHSHGGAFCVNSPLVTVGDCVFLNNSAAQGGATTYLMGCSALREGRDSIGCDDVVVGYLATFKIILNDIRPLVWNYYGEDKWGDVGKTSLSSRLKKLVGLK